MPRNLDLLCSCTNPVFGKNLVREIFVFYKQQFYKPHQAEVGKNQTKARQHSEAELLLFENYVGPSSVISSKTNIRYSKKVQKTSLF